MNHQRLESERYYLQDLEKKIGLAVKQRNRKAFRDFATLLVGLALIPLACILGQQMPVWTPVVHDWVTAGIDVIFSSDSPIGQALGL